MTMVCPSLTKLWLTTIRLANRRASCVLAVIAAMTAGVMTPVAMTPGAALAGERAFPFGHELLLDVAPMKGSKRVPMLTIDEKGYADIDLWCDSVKGQMVVAGDTITILTDDKTDRSCPPERAAADEDMLARLAGVVSWRREGDVLLLSGAGTMRFRLQTN
jgi:heat shock protein HslJ